MQEITQKLHKKVMDDFTSIAEEMAEKGYDKDHIVSVFQAQLRLKVKQYHSNMNKIKTVGESLKGWDNLIPKQTADSKAESIFYEILTSCGIKFEFQYKIGPYTADYLFSGFLVVELDGPQHGKEHDDRRDEYMRRMGYKIIRVPIWILVSCPDAVVEEIQAAMREYTIKNKLTKKRN